ncbi:MAG: FISUMP domain-containing protein, partial [Bacteroidota bacterium]
FAEVLPASVKFKDALIPYMESRWIFSKALFEVVISDFQSQVSTGLNLKPSFRTISAADGLVSSGTQYFISSMTTLEYYWNKLTAVFGDFPSYKNTEAATSLATSEISISGVSNANVQYVSHSDQAVTFKSVSGKDETFNYTLRVTKQGFTEEKTLTAKVKVNCSAITFGTSMSAEGSIAILNVQGGVAPYMYSVANSPYQSSQIFVGPYVSGNSYLIKIKDANNCETSETRLISKDPCSNLSTITDPRDGEVYKIVQIGNQTWFVENLRYSGNVPNISDYNQWTNNTTGAWSYYLNDASFNIPYGKLYNWHAVKNSSICPAGWHVPSDAEWTSLAVFLGGESVAGGKMKSTGTQYWQTPNTDATNSSCFSALPGGYRSNAGVFNYKGSQGNWWSSTDNNVGGAWYRGIDNNAGSLGKGEFTKLAGYSVRCVKD